MKYVMLGLTVVMMLISIYSLVRPFLHKQYNKQESELVFVASKGTYLFIVSVLFMVIICLVTVFTKSSKDIYLLLYSVFFMAYKACEKLVRSYIIFLKNGALIFGTYFSDEEIESNGKIEELSFLTKQRVLRVTAHRKAAFIYVSEKREHIIFKRYPNLYNNVPREEQE